MKLYLFCVALAAGLGLGGCDKPPEPAAEGPQAQEVILQVRTVDKAGAPVEMVRFYINGKKFGITDQDGAFKGRYPAKDGELLTFNVEAPAGYSVPANIDQSRWRHQVKYPTGGRPLQLNFTATLQRPERDYLFMVNAKTPATPVTVNAKAVGKTGMGGEALLLVRGEPGARFAARAGSVILNGEFAEDEEVYLLTSTRQGAVGGAPVDAAAVPPDAVGAVGSEVPPDAVGAVGSEVPPDAVGAVGSEVPPDAVGAVASEAPAVAVPTEVVAAVEAAPITEAPVVAAPETEPPPPAVAVAEVTAAPVTDAPVAIAPETAPPRAVVAVAVPARVVERDPFEAVAPREPARRAPVEVAEVEPQPPRRREPVEEPPPPRRKPVEEPPPPREPEAEPVLEVVREPIIDTPKAREGSIDDLLIDPSDIAPPQPDPVEPVEVAVQPLAREPAEPGKAAARVKAEGQLGDGLIDEGDTLVAPGAATVKPTVGGGAAPAASGMSREEISGRLDSIGAGLSSSGVLKKADVDFLGQVDRTHPGYFEANRLLAEFYYQLKDYKRQSEALEIATTQGRYKHDPTILLSLAKSYALRKNYGKALGTMRRVEEKMRNLPAAKKADAFRFYAEILEFEFLRQFDEDPKGANATLVDKAIEKWDRYRTFNQGADPGGVAKAEKKIKELQELKEKVE